MKWTVLTSWAWQGHYRQLMASIPSWLAPWPPQARHPRTFCWSMAPRTAPCWWWLSPAPGLVSGWVRDWWTGWSRWEHFPLSPPLGLRHRNKSQVEHGVGEIDYHIECNPPKGPPLGLRHRNKSQVEHGFPELTIMLSAVRPRSTSRLVA